MGSFQSQRRSEWPLQLDRIGPADSWAETGKQSLKCERARKKIQSPRKKNRNERTTYSVEHAKENEMSSDDCCNRANMKSGVRLISVRQAESQMPKEWWSFTMTP